MTTGLPKWTAIDTVLLDMDGALLDLHFDNHFWLEHVPVRYAARYRLGRARAKAECMARYRSVFGTLDWYCIDYWSEQLGLDIMLLEREVSHRIAVLPHVVDFLDSLAVAGKRRVLVTNAHRKSLGLKMQHTCLHRHLDRLICSHDIGVAKEHPEFWPRFQEIEPFDPARVLFVDDSLPVLRAARKYGIDQLLAMRHPDRCQPPRKVEEFPSVLDFDEVLPGLHTVCPRTAN